jgi:hypothetical protein
MATCAQRNVSRVRFEVQWDALVSQGRTGCGAGKVKGGIRVRSGQVLIPEEREVLGRREEATSPEGVRVNESVDEAACG